MYIYKQSADKASSLSNPKIIDDIVKRFNNKEIGIFPTDTVFGLGGILKYKSVYDRLYEIKKRPKNKFLILQVAYIKDIDKLVAKKFDYVDKILHNFWPGPLTVVFNSSDYLKSNYNWKPDTVAIRISNHRFLRTIIKKLDAPLLVTSANLSGENIPNSYEDMVDLFKDNVDFMVFDDIVNMSIPSTIVDVTKEEPIILREGVISKKDIEKITDIINVD